MHEPRKIARAFLVEGDVDIQMAKLAFINSFYSRCIFFAQQASDKAVKACLAMKGVHTTDHNTSALFRALFENSVDGFPKIFEAMEKLEKYGARARFPLFQRPDLPIWIPSHSFKEAEAKDSLEKGETVFFKLREFIELELTPAQGK